MLSRARFSSDPIDPIGGKPLVSKPICLGQIDYSEMKAP